MNHNFKELFQSPHEAPHPVTGGSNMPDFLRKELRRGATLSKTSESGYHVLTQQSEMRAQAVQMSLCTIPQEALLTASCRPAKADKHPVKLPPQEDGSIVRKAWQRNVRRCGNSMCWEEITTVQDYCMSAISVSTMATPTCMHFSVWPLTVVMDVTLRVLSVYRL